MAQCGTLTFYSTSAHSEPRRLLSQALALAGGSKVLYAYRSVEEDDRWARFRGGEDLDYEYIAGHTPMAEVPSLWKPGTSLSVSIEPNRMGGMFERVMQERIPANVRGNFIPCQTDLQIGWHDIIEETEEPPHYGRLIARAFFAFKLFGYGTPSDWAGYRRVVFDVPEVKQLRANLEQIVGGPVEPWVSWSV